MSSLFLCPIFFPIIYLMSINVEENLQQLKNFGFSIVKSDELKIFSMSESHNRKGFQPIDEFFFKIFFVNT